MKPMFIENKTKNCGCCSPKGEEEIFCSDCANFWQSTLARDHLPFANLNSKISWMNEMISYWASEIKEKSAEKLGV